MRFNQIWNKTGSVTLRLQGWFSFQRFLSCWSAGSVSGVKDQILVDVRSSGNNDQGL